MENRKWEEELAGRWREISGLVAGGVNAQAAQDNDRLPVIRSHKIAERGKVKQKLRIKDYELRTSTDY